MSRKNGRRLRRADGALAGALVLGSLPMMAMAQDAMPEPAPVDDTAAASASPAPEAGAAADTSEAFRGWYLGLEGGANFAHKQKYKIYYPDGGGAVADGSQIATSKLKDGFIGGLVMGYSSDNGLRTELSLDWRQNDIKSTFVEAVPGPLGLPIGGVPAFQATGVHGKEQVQTAMLSVYYDLFRSGWFHPYLGGGAGAARIDYRNPGYDGQDLNGDDDIVFAWQAGGGIGVDLSRHWSLSVDYRYLRSDRAKVNLVDDTPESRVKFRYESDAVLLGLRYTFGSDPEVAPAPAPVQVVESEPAPPPPPPPPPACSGTENGASLSLDGCKTGDTLVLRGVNFDFDKATLTSNATTILDNAADALKSRPDIKVLVAGHTDSKGSDGYNEGLSRRRAETVKQYLAGHGVESSRMTTQGFGESQPIADNGTDEGRELNRRVELKVTESDSSLAKPTSTVPGDGSAPAGDAAPAAEPAQ